MKLLTCLSATCMVLAGTNSWGSWEYTDSLAFPRYNHEVIVLGGDTVFACGGENDSGALRSCEIWNAFTGNWSLTGDMDSARTNHTATLLPNGNLYIAGGANAGGDVTSCILYDPATGSWFRSCTRLEAGHNHSASLLRWRGGENVLIAGGEYQGSFRNECLVYDWTSEQVCRTWNMNVGRAGHIALDFAYGRVLVIGGRTPSGVTAGCELYEETTWVWTPTGSLITGRVAHNAVLLRSGEALVIGGMDSAGVALTSCEILHPDTGVWKPTGSLNYARYDHGSVLLPSGYVMVAGGHDGVTALSSCEIWDPSTRNWSLTDSLNAARDKHTMSWIDTGCVLVTGGIGDSGSLSSCEIRKLFVKILGGCYYRSGTTGVHDVEVHLSGGYLTTELTDSCGHYSLFAEIGGDYTVTPAKLNTVSLDAISAYDAALILRHMVGYDTLSDYDSVAAEVDGNTLINPDDASLVLEYSVEKIQHFPIGDWTFNPESVSYVNVVSDTTDQNYAALLYGDVSGNWPDSKGFTAYTHAADTIPVTIPRVSGRPGDTVNVPVEVGDVAGRGILSCDITLVFDSLIVRALEADTGQIIPAGWILSSCPSPGKIHIGLAGAHELTLSGQLLYVPFVVDIAAQGGDSTAIHFSDFEFNEGAIPVALQDGALCVETGVEETVGAGQHAELSISPNPFMGKTVIEFRVRSSQFVDERLFTLKIHDLSGRLVRSFDLCNLDKSVKSVLWDGKNDSGKEVRSGVYFCRLQLADHTVTKKIQVIR